ncbi:MAG: flavodoxin [Bacilli bacterium]
MKSIVVYFSKNGENIVDHKVVDLPVGNTEIIARKIQALTSSDIFELKPVRPYPYKYDDCLKVAEKEYQTNECHEFVHTYENLSDYDVVFIGFPIWYKSYPRIINRFIKEYDLKDKTILPFCTNDEGNFGIAELELRSLLSSSSLKPGFYVQGKDIHICNERLERWISRYFK